MTLQTSLFTAHPYDDITLETLFDRGGGKWGRYDRDVISACTVETDFPVAGAVQSRIMEMVEAGRTGYANFPKPPLHLFEAWAGFSDRHFGWAPDAALSFCTDYPTNGLSEAMRALLEPGSEVAYTTPGFASVVGIIERAGLVPRQINHALQLDRPAEYMDLDVIEAAFADGVRAFVLINPHHPHGFVASRDHLAAFAALADRYGVRVFADEVFAPSTFPGETFTPFASLDAESARRSVTVTTGSKVWNLRAFPAAILYAADEATAVTLRTPGMDRVMSQASFVGTEALVTALTSTDGWLASFTAYLDRNARFVEEEFPKLLPGIRIARAASGFTVWLDLGEFGVDEPTPYLIEHAKVGMSRGQHFGPEGFRCVRLNIGTPTHVLAEIGSRMAAAL
ncbi:hypothetical protein B7R54_02565 [Subtercola boreus]|uniref:cysteine-S-conjugate beta-lyase n=1 Tax=Subtercola boreus TaxID=120213 RepID=A0A3E0VEY7_9MICO|nr:aminotransferase class I/II-fold pyridoxal phosphate-dependent enzyme [Subtercola boreus]RFA08229.1 hypothetical protein B7R54_02565 [Subtercola boreus]TQL54877.1 cystathionine beta-lyase [Subtercola boreus]